MAGARHVVVFSGHRIDAPDRPRPRFPATHAAAFGQRVRAALTTLDIGPGDLAMTQGAAGGDIVFAEAALARGARLRLLLPLDENEFVARSILPAEDGVAWRDRFDALLRRIGAAGCSEAPVALGDLADGDDPFVRGNRWLLDEAFAAASPQAPQVVCLWDGRGGDGPGGTAHLVAEARRRGGDVVVIDPANL